MAFQVGSTIRPELGSADYSGFARAAEIQAATLAQLGATIGGAIQVAGEKKKEKALSKQAQEMVFGMLKKDPAQASFFGLGEDFTLADVKPIVDVIGVKPSIALITQLNMASMQASQTKIPTISDLTKLREFLPADKIIQNGVIVDTTLRNEVLPRDHPLVQQILNSNMASQLYGYQPPEPVKLNVEDEDIEVNVPVDESVEVPVEPADESVKTSKRTLPESEFMRFGIFDARF